MSSVKTYSGEDVSVSYDSSRCLHVAECVRGLNAVFDTDNRPWIQPDKAAAETVAETVRRCPTGALHYALVAGDKEEAEPETRITPQPDGPLYIRGNLKFVKMGCSFCL